MSIADILINLIIWIVQKIILPVLPVNIPYFSFDTFTEILSGSLKHNFIWGLAGLNQFMNLNLLFILVGVIITAEIIFWGLKAGIFVWKSVRGSG
jgi:hypothetical protein